MLVRIEDNKGDYTSRRIAVECICICMWSDGDRYVIRVIRNVLSLIAEQKMGAIYFGVKLMSAMYLSSTARG